MSEVFSTRYRTDVAATLRASDIGREVRLVGWVHRRRDLGGLVFVDLRDRGGLLQVSFDPDWTPAEVLREARHFGPEDVIQVEGTIERRLKENPEMATGEIEMRCTSLRVLQRADALPIPVYRSPDEALPTEDLRLRYRYLDLRRPELLRNFELRHATARAVRGYLDTQHFLEVETPMLTRRTPEGARDYLVPSRVHPGEFYALPQSPQIYKQLLMVSGFDRYYQIVRCLRDEDLRADRQPEFTQVDAEMAFVDEEDVYRVAEGMIAAVWREVLGVELPIPFPRLTYDEALSRYGTDKPDLRFGLEILDLTELLAASEFRVFAGTRGTAQRIRGFRVPGGASLSRRELDDLQEVARRGGAPGVLWVKRAEGGYSGVFAKALVDGVDAAFSDATGMEDGDLFVAVVGEFRSGGARPAEGGPVAGLEPALDELRRHLAARMDLIDRSAHAWAWITEFPLFDWDPEQERLVAAHHPFTMPHPDDVERLREVAGQGRPLTPDEGRSLLAGGMRSLAYDAVYNGNELASGSVRIHDRELQGMIFRALGMAEEEARGKFGFLLEAFRYGAPPHAGFAFGFDRLAMLLAGAASLRDVIAFPKTTAARGLMEGAPAGVAEDDLRDLHIRLEDQRT